jgi:phage gpG-like protein
MAEMEVKVEDNTDKVKQQLNKAIEMVLFAWGTEGVAGCVEKASANEWGKDGTDDTVDTGRYRAGFGFITPSQGKMSGTPTSASESTDNFAGQRADKDTVIIANNVEYAPFLEVGTSRMKARHIMKRGIESKIDTMKKDMKQILKGEGDMSISGI